MDERFNACMRFLIIMVIMLCAPSSSGMAPVRARNFHTALYDLDTELNTALQDYNQGSIIETVIRRLNGCDDRDLTDATQGARINSVLSSFLCNSFIEYNGVDEIGIIIHDPRQKLIKDKRAHAIHALIEGGLLDPNKNLPVPNSTIANWERDDGFRDQGTPLQLASRERGEYSGSRVADIDLMFHLINNGAKMSAKNARGEDWFAYVMRALPYGHSFWTSNAENSSAMTIPKLMTTLGTWMGHAKEGGEENFWMDVCSADLKASVELADRKIAEEMTQISRLSELIREKVMAHAFLVRAANYVSIDSRILVDIQSRQLEKEFEEGKLRRLKEGKKDIETLMNKECPKRRKRYDEEKKSKLKLLKEETAMPGVLGGLMAGYLGSDFERVHNEQQEEEREQQQKERLGLGKSFIKPFSQQEGKRKITAPILWRYHKPTFFPRKNIK